MTLTEESQRLPNSLPEGLGTLKSPPAPPTPQPNQNAGLAMQARYASCLGRLTTVGQEDYSLGGLPRQFNVQIKTRAGAMVQQ